MRKLLMTTALVAGSLGVASAQDANNIFRPAPEATELHASDFIGMRIYRLEGDVAADGYAGVQQDWDDIGEINDVIFSREGEVEAVLVDIGGFLGMGESQVAVDMKSIQFVSDSATDDADDFFLVLNAPRSVFETAPTYDMSSIDGTATDATVDGQATTDVAADTTAPAADADATANTDTTVAADTTAPAADATVDGAADTNVAADTTAPAADATVDGTMNTDVAADTTMRDGWTPVQAAELTSEQLTGAAVYGPDDQSIGEISDIVLTADGQVKGAVVDVGGFLGMGEKPVELDLSQVEILRQADGDDLRVYVSMTKEQVEALPEFEG